MKSTNTLYKNQVAILAFIASVTFKMSMLPQYLTKSVGTQAWIVMLIMMSIEVLCFCVIYSVISKHSIQEMQVNKYINSAIMILIFASSFIKFLILGSEALTFLSLNMFENGGWHYLLLAVLPVVAYLAYKGANTLGRVGQIMVFIIVPTLVFSVALFDQRPDFAEILPVFNGGVAPIFDGISSHFVWFGDFTPLLFLRVKDQKSGKSIGITLCFIYIFCIFFIMLFTAIFGEAGIISGSAFGRLARFNRVSSLFGGVDFPIVIMWIMLAMVKLALLAFAMVESATYITKARGISSVTIMIGLYFCMVFGLGNMDASYNLATSWVRWAIAGVEYGTPLVYFGITEVKNAKNAAQ